MVEYNEVGYSQGAGAMSIDREHHVRITLRVCEQYLEGALA